MLKYKKGLIGLINTWDISDGAITMNKINAELLSKMLGAGVIVVAAADTPEKLKKRADYVCTGTNTTGGDQNTINTALSEGKAVLLLPGTYWLSGPILPGNNQMLVGSGWNTVIKLRDNHNADVFLILVDGKSGVIIRDLVVDGNKDNQSIGGVRGIHFNAVEYSAVLYCKVLNTRKLFNGISLYNGSRYNIILGNICIGNDYHGINLNNCSKNIIVGNIVMGSVRNGIVNHNLSNHNVIVGNLCENNGYYGIEIRYSGYCVVKGNIVVGNQRHGIYLSAGASNNIVSNNMLFGNGVSDANTYDNILIEGNYNSIFNNVCRHDNVTRYGIRISSSSYNNNVIHGNDLYASGLSGALYDAGTNTRRRDNIGNDGNWLTDA